MGHIYIGIDHIPHAGLEAKFWWNVIQAVMKEITKSFDIMHHIVVFIFTCYEGWIYESKYVLSWFCLMLIKILNDFRPWALDVGNLLVFITAFLVYIL